MGNTNIISLIDGLEIPYRLSEIVISYLLSLMLPADKHTLTNAEKISGKANSLFTNLLDNLNVPIIALNRAARRKIAKVMKLRRPLCKGAPWSIAIIIDSTLHERSTRHTENSQKFNHGKGYVLGHQWTNAAILINDELIPLPPIPFYTIDECKDRNKEYRTEHEKIINFIRTMSLPDLLGEDCASEIVVLTDSGYDNNDIQNAIAKRGMSYVASIKTTRKIFINKSNASEIAEYFKDGRRPCKTVKLRVDGKNKKWRCYAIKQQEGTLKGSKRIVKLVCSKRSNGKMKFLSCSKSELDAKIIIALYQRRWEIELFHKAIKSYLGLEDAGLHSFDRLHAHVLWVYTAFILINELPCKAKKIGIKKRQEFLVLSIQSKNIKSILKKSTQINGLANVKKHCLSVIQCQRNGLYNVDRMFKR